MKKIALLFLIFCLSQIAQVHAADVPTMTKDQLNGLLGDESLVIYDVRQGRDWSTSEFKIKGAIRVEGDITQIAGEQSKDKTFVLYCA